MDVLCLQETWWNIAPDLTAEEFQAIGCLHSTPREKRGEGVAILYKKTSVTAQASLEQLWEPSLMTVVLHKKNGKGPRRMVLTNFYGRPTATKESLEFLKFVINAIHDHQKAKVQILCGDFN